MAFTKEFLQPQRWDEFHYYFSGKANGWEDQSLDFISEGYRFKVGEVRVHFSSAFASVEDFVMYRSAINGSMYNNIWISEALNGVRDLVLFFSDPLNFFSDDQLVFTGSMVSNTNGYSLEVFGWAARG
jgi:hypothetical protein